MTYAVLKATSVSLLKNRESAVNDLQKHAIHIYRKFKIKNVQGIPCLCNLNILECNVNLI